MSAKNVDNHNRFRSITVGFHVSPEEAKELNNVVALSGLPKREYCLRRCMEKDIIVQGNPKVYKALKSSLAEVLDELKRIQSADEISDVLLATIQQISVTLNGLKEEAE